MAAVIAPIGIDHPQLRHRGISLFLVPEIIPAEQQIGKGHGKSHRIKIALHLSLIPGDKARHPGNIRRTLRLQFQGFRLLHRGHTGFHRVYQICFDLFKLFLGHISFHADHLGGKYGGTLPLRQQLNALCGGIGPLVILAGQVFRGKGPVFQGQAVLLPIDAVHVGLGKNSPCRRLKLLLAQAGNIVPVENTYFLNTGNTQVFLEISLHLGGLNIKPFPLFHKNARYHSRTTVLSLCHSCYQMNFCRNHRCLFPVRQQLPLQRTHDKPETPRFPANPRDETGLRRRFFPSVIPIKKNRSRGQFGFTSLYHKSVFL